MVALENNRFDFVGKFGWIRHSGINRDPHYRAVDKADAFTVNAFGGESHRAVKLNENIGKSFVRR